MPEAQQAAEAAAAAADAAGIQNLPAALDEFGRDMNVEKRRQVRSFAPGQSCPSSLSGLASHLTGIVVVLRNI